MKALTDMEKFCLTAYALNPCITSKRLAYRCSRGDKIKATGASLDTQISRWFNRKEIQGFIKIELERRSTEIHLDADPDADNVSREELLRELSISFRSVTDPKLKSEIGLKIADLQKFKQNPVEENRVLVYRQLECDECPLYIAKKAELAQRQSVSDTQSE